MKDKKEKKDKANEEKVEFPKAGLFIIGGIVLLMIICAIVLYALGGPVK